MTTNLINQSAFNAGFQEVLAKRGLLKAAADAPVPEPGFFSRMWQGTGIPGAAQDFSQGTNTGAVAAGVSLPLLAAAWYWHNKHQAERDAQTKTATLGGTAGALTGAAAVGFPLFGVLGAYQLAEYLKNRQEAPPQPDLDTILNFEPQSNAMVPTQEEKKQPLP